MYTVAHSNSAMSAADDVYYKVVQHLHVDKLYFDMHQKVMVNISFTNYCWS